MPTRGGFLLVLASVLVIVAGRVFGLAELFVLGVTGLALVAFAALYVGVRRLQVQVRRELSPPRVHVGSPGRVELRLRNRASFASPVLQLEDAVSGTQGVDLHVPPLRSDEETVAVYRLPTDRRGAVVVGPLRLTVTDPFGLARLSSTAERKLTLLVYPRLDAVKAPPRAAGTSPERGAHQRDRVAPSGEEFAGLRDYVVGDDLRRVHWASSARHDDLVVRQEEAPWLGRTTVLLDTRAATVGAVDFEEMVSAAASLVVASERRGDQIRLLTSGGFDSGSGSGRRHLETMLVHLALVAPDDEPLGPAIAHLGGSHGGSVTVVLAPADHHEGRLLDLLGSGYARRVLVQFLDATAAEQGASLPSGTVINVPPSTPFAPAWAAAMGPSLTRSP